MISTLPRWINLAREAAVIIGAIASLVVLLGEAFLAQGVIIPNDIPRTIVNLGLAALPIVQAWATRQRVFSEKSVVNLTGKPLSELPPPPGGS
jgi:hypothetical protein